MLLQQPDFLKMIQDVQKNPDNMNQYLTDPRMMQVLGVLLNVNLRTATLEEDYFEQSSSPRPQPKNNIRTSARVRARARTNGYSR